MKHWVMRRTVITVVVILLALTALGITLLMRDGRPVEAVEARRGEIRQYIDEQAVTRLPERFVVTTPFAGRVEQLQLQVGQPVQQGEVVASMVSDDLQHELAEARAAVERLEASLAERRDLSVETTARRQAEQLVAATAYMVEGLEHQITIAHRRLEFAAELVEDTRRLVRQGARMDEELQRAEVELVASQAQLGETEKNLQAAIAMLGAVNMMPVLIDQFISRREMEGSAAEAQKDEAEARLRQIQLRVERGTMYSPVDGVVLRRPQFDEQFLPAGTALLEIGRLADLEVEADLLSQEAVRVHPGDEVEIYGATMGLELGQGVPGTVERIEPQAFTKISALGVEQQRVTTVIRFDEAAWTRLQPLNLGVEYRLRVRIYTDRADEALLIPRTALFRGPDGQWLVYVVEQDRTNIRSVTIGLMDDQWAQVTAGLVDGEVVVAAPESDLREGLRVRAVRQLTEAPSVANEITPTTLTLRGTSRFGRARLPPSRGSETTLVFLSARKCQEAKSGSYFVGDPTAQTFRRMARTCPCYPNHRV